MQATQSTRPGIGRGVVAATMVTVVSIVWTHGLSAVLRHLGPDGAPTAAWGLTLGAGAVALASALGWGRRGGRLAGVGAGALALALVATLAPGSWAGALALPLVGAVVGPLGLRFAAMLPARWDAPAASARFARVAWVLLAAVTVLQVARLSTYMTDPESDWFLSTRHPFWAKHECLPAYFQGAELAAGGDPNLYDAAHYPGLNPEAAPETRLVGMTPEDPFQYTPQFLLLPYLGTLATLDYATLKLGWFALQTSFFLLVLVSLARWVGGRAGELGLALWPLALIAFPAMHSLQYGQFHLAAIGLGVAGMLAVEKRRDVLGGALLAAAVLSKLFPALLLIPLIRQRRLRPLAWAAGFGAAATLATVVTFGLSPFRAFFGYHVPRLANGQAFAFGEAWPEVRELVIAANQGFFGLVVKLGEMGVPGADTTTAVWVNRAAAVALLALALWVGARIGDASREQRAITWLSLIGLGSMLSTGAFGDYVPVAATWMLTLAASRATSSRAALAWVLPAWALQLTILGAAPLGDFAPVAFIMPVSALGVVALVAVYGWALGGLRRRHPASAQAAVPARSPVGDARGAVSAA